MVCGFSVSSLVTVSLSTASIQLSVMVSTLFSMLWVLSLMLNVEPSNSSCNTSVSVQDLACRLHWSCFDIDPNTTFTVQTKTQGSGWQNVSECVQITSNSCDLSQAFAHYFLYDFVRLGLNHRHDDLQWITTHCNHLKNTRFSAPSVSLSLDNQLLWVEVTFPCAPSVSCLDDDAGDEWESSGEDAPTCCSLFKFYQLNTTVMLYNQLNKSDIKIHNQLVSDQTLKVKFGRLVPGQKYCAHAQFASSPSSDLQCIHIQVPGSGWGTGAYPSFSIDAGLTVTPWMVRQSIAGQSNSSCNTSVSVQDLACRLHWSCFDIEPNTTFTVQTKNQGSGWQNVSECVQITSNSCDLSQAFAHYFLYDFVRLGLNHRHDDLQWITTHCNHLKNTRFSAPSVSLSLDDQLLWVEVTFPCAPSVSCLDDDDDAGDEGESSGEDAPTCCSLSKYYQLNTTVMLYNQLNKSDIKIHNQLVSDQTLKVKFGRLVPGQKYCAHAQFASSPSSDLQCIHIQVPERPNLFLLGLCGVLIALLIMLCVLGRRCFSTEVRIPKPLISLLDEEASTIPEFRQETLLEDGPFTHLSIVSLPSMVSLDTQSIHTRTQDVEDRYYTAAILQYQDYLEEHKDTEIHSGDLEMDGEVCSGHYPWPRWSSLPALRPGMVCLLGVSLPLEESSIPLSSVRVAGLPMEEIAPNYLVKTIQSQNGNENNLFSVH